MAPSDDWELGGLVESVLPERVGETDAVSDQEQYNKQGCYTNPSAPSNPTGLKLKKKVMSSWSNSPPHTHASVTQHSITGDTHTQLKPPTRSGCVDLHFP